MWELETCLQYRKKLVRLKTMYLHVVQYSVKTLINIVLFTLFRLTKGPDSDERLNTGRTGSCSSLSVCRLWGAYRLKSDLEWTKTSFSLFFNSVQTREILFLTWSDPYMTTYTNNMSKMNLRVKTVSLGHLCFKLFVTYGSFQLHSSFLWWGDE